MPVNTKGVVLGLAANAVNELILSERKLVLPMTRGYLKEVREQFQTVTNDLSPDTRTARLSFVFKGEHRTRATRQSHQRWHPCNKPQA